MANTTSRRYFEAPGRTQVAALFLSGFRDPTPLSENTPTEGIELPQTATRIWGLAIRSFVAFWVRGCPFHVRARAAHAIRARAAQARSWFSPEAPDLLRGAA